MTTHVSVETLNLETGHRDMKVIDHDEHNSRVWLGRHCYWGMRNGYQVTTGPTSAPVTYRPQVRNHPTSGEGESE
jgi:hypothetical protein